jgi:GYF domain 2
MSNSKSDAWFYSHQGDRYGPVTFDDLQAMAKNGVLNPRLDLVWKDGMAEWQLASEMKGLFERSAPVEKERESLAPRADVFTSPSHGTLATSMGAASDWPGARRRSFLFIGIIFPILWKLALDAGDKHLTALMGPEMMKVAGVWLPLLPLVLLLFVVINRFRNLGMSPLWILASWIPFLNIWLGYRTFACPAGYAYHKKLDGIGILLAILYGLTAIIMIVAIAAGGAIFFGALGDPEIKKQIEDALQQFMQEVQKAAPVSTPKP